MLGNAIRQAYRKIVPYYWRFHFYKLRNREHFRHLRKVVYPSIKGDFSLKPFDEHQCIFVHVTKSAGTSVAKALFGYLPYHYTAMQYKVIYGRKTFNDYYKFGFVRNPWDRLYSSYSYLKGGGWNESDRKWADENLGHIVDFEDFILNWLNKDRLRSHVHFWPQYWFICDKKQKILLDYLAYFETISEDFNYLADRLNINATLDHLNRSNRVSYLDAYSKTTIAKVAELYRTDIELFGYEFDRIAHRTLCEEK